MNEPLEIGDRVMLLHMEDTYSNIMPGTWGTVRGKSDFQGITQYNMSWDDGTKEKKGKQISTLGLLSDVDLWTKNPPKKKIRESFTITKRDFLNKNLKKINNYLNYL